MHCREVAEVIIESDVWLEALKSEFISPVTGIKDTPLRLLIKVFPELAKRVFDRCMQTNLKSKVSTVANGKKVPSGQDEQPSRLNIMVYLGSNYRLSGRSYLCHHLQLRAVGRQLHLVQGEGGGQGELLPEEAGQPHRG